MPFEPLDQVDLKVLQDCPPVCSGLHQTGQWYQCSVCSSRMYAVLSREWQGFPVAKPYVCPKELEPAEFPDCAEGFLFPTGFLIRGTAGFIHSCTHMSSAFTTGWWKPLLWPTTVRGSWPPPGLQAHSTRGMATSLFKGISLQDICSAENWSSPHMEFMGWG